MANLGKVDYLFIVNQKVPKENILEINRHFRGRNRQFICTKRWKEAVEKIADLDAQKSFKTAIAVGGDGTVNAVVNGLMKHKNSRTFGVIPLGTGNDFAKSLNLPKSVEENCRLILSAEPKEIDVGKINEFYFANIASIGIDALATKLSANQSGVWKKIHPAVHYALGLLKAILRYKAADFKIIGTYLPSPREDSAKWGSRPEPEIELGFKKKVLLAAFANGKIYGGNFPIAPTAKIDDKNLTLCVIEAMPFWKTLRNLPKLLAAKHGELKEVLFADFKGIIIASDNGLVQI
ncbi:MAG: diacylglycerol kinase family protein, partial [Patescibacteria group bacterium]